MKFLSSVIPVFVFLMFAGCSSGSDQDKYHDVPASKLFAMAQDELSREHYPEAIEMFESFDSQYPTSPKAEQALVEYIYAQYRVEEHALAVAAADRFLKLYPRSKKVDYVLYLKGIINSEQERTFFDSLFSENLSERDYTFFKEAYDDFAVLVDRFPKSPYEADARHRMIFLRNMLVQSELNVSKFYMRKALYVAAVNRAVYVVENFPQAPQVVDALGIIIQANRKMDFKKSMRDAIRIVKLNFPAAEILKSV